jgi:FkbH-like protein
VKLVEALRFSRQAAAREAEEFGLFLACSFPPLHLGTFLGAHLATEIPGRRIVVDSRHCGNLIDNLHLGEEARRQNIVVAIEWWDLDPRLSMRSLGGWNDAENVLRTVETASRRLRQSLSTIQAGQIVVSFPTLPFPPVFPVTSELLGRAETCVRHSVGELVHWAVGRDRMHLLHPDALAELSPMAERWDVRMDLATGFPYKLKHADALAGMCARSLTNETRGKGIIIDADDTLWQGIAGEIGAENVSWSLENDSQTHGLFQQALAVLANRGVLIAIASKNDRDVVIKALERTDLAISKDVFFPVEAHWGRKSESVARILRAWNVDAASVVFVDDDAMEIAEVQQRFPSLRCRVFPRGDAAGVMELLKWLRDEFGREFSNDEDDLRRHSIEQNLAFEAEGKQTDSEGFLKALEANITIKRADRMSSRAWELINKTNQFNLNGSRYTMDQWRARGERDSDFVLTVTYADRFGSLGTIATMAGRADERRLYLEDWAISCRAFSRRVEYLCLAFLFDRFEKDAISIAFRATERNCVAQNLVKSFFGSTPINGTAELILTSELFGKECPRLYHRVSYYAG